MEAGWGTDLDVPGFAHRVLQRLEFTDRLGPDAGLGKNDPFLLKEDGERVDQLRLRFRGERVPEFWGAPTAVRMTNQSVWSPEKVPLAHDRVARRKARTDREAEPAGRNGSCPCPLLIPCVKEVQKTSPGRAAGAPPRRPPPKRAADQGESSGSTASSVDKAS